MKININNLDINYQVKGDGDNLIIIHGWGENITTFTRMINTLSLNHRCYALDLPGFGESDHPDKIYSTSDYASILENFIKNFKIKNPTLIGHSFGGKVIIDLLVNHLYHPKRVILIASSGIKKRRSFIKMFKIIRYKVWKKLLKIFSSKENYETIINELSKKSGSPDYNHAKGIMRPTFVKIVNEDYSKKLSLIKSPTLLIWGETDHEVPIKYAKKMHQRISDSGLVIIKKASHFPFITHFSHLIKIIESFLSS